MGSTGRLPGGGGSEVGAGEAEAGAHKYAGYGIPERPYKLAQDGIPRSDPRCLCSSVRDRDGEILEVLRSNIGRDLPNQLHLSRREAIQLARYRATVVLPGFMHVQDSQQLLTQTTPPTSSARSRSPSAER